MRKKAFEAPITPRTHRVNIRSVTIARCLLATSNSRHNGARKIPKIVRGWSRARPRREREETRRDETRRGKESATPVRNNSRWLKPANQFQDRKLIGRIPGVFHRAAKYTSAPGPIFSCIAGTWRWFARRMPLFRSRNRYSREICKCREETGGALTNSHESTNRPLWWSSLVAVGRRSQTWLLIDRFIVSRNVHTLEPLMHLAEERGQNVVCVYPSARIWFVCVAREERKWWFRVSNDVFILFSMFPLV